MEKQKPIAGEFYRHFKGGLYQVKMLAKDSDSLKEKVVYQAMYAPFECWVRDLEEFTSKVDKEKYPDAGQEFRFEKVKMEMAVSEKEEGDDGKEVRHEIDEISDEALKKALQSGQPKRYLNEKITEEEIAQRGLLQLLDADGFREKRQIFIGLKSYLNERMLSNIAVALDIVLEDGDLETQYESIMRCMEAFEHYEGRRLR